MASVRAAGLTVARAATRRWPAGSRLFLVGEGAGWSIDHDMRVAAGLARSLGIRVADRRLLRAARDQAAFVGSQFTLLGGTWEPPPHRLAVAYFHGRPGTPGMPEFDACYASLRAHHAELARVQVSHSELEELVLSSGIEQGKVHRIPIGVQAETFAPVSPERRAEARGSFHKDGVGWGEGLEPKPIKGPDVLLAALETLHRTRPELHVVLSGPARGYVLQGLARLGIPAVHRQLDRYEAIADLYAALDAYVVPSRQEGGPKGVLEAMASGVPLVTTRVGQAMDIVRHGENGWMVESEDAAGLAYWLDHVAGAGAELAPVLAAGLETARAHAYEAQLPLWRSFYDGFVELG